MDYAFWFWILIAFIAGRMCPRSFYIGSEKDKYDKAEAGILLEPED